LEALAEPGDERPAARDGRLYRGQFQRGGVILATLPHFCHPQRVVVACVGCDDVAAATWHRAGAGQQDLDERVAHTRLRDHLPDQSVQMTLLGGLVRSTTVQLSSLSAPATFSTGHAREPRRCSRYCRPHSPCRAPACATA